MKFTEQESSTIELKRELPKNEQIIKTVVGFCNLYGGKLILGVDNDGTIIGLDEVKIQEAMEYLEQSIYQASTPPIVPRIYSQRILDKVILIIEVFAGTSKPYYVRSEGIDKGVYIRLGRSTVRAHPDMIRELTWLARRQFLDTIPAYQATLDDLDMKMLTSSLDKNAHKKNEPASQELLLSYHLIAQEQTHSYPTVAGMLLFGKDPQHFLPEAFIILTYFAGTEGRDVIATKDCMGTLQQQFACAFEWILSQLNSSFVITGPRRTQQLEIPEEAIREALLNAIIHRNYTIQGPIKVALYRNRLEIFSPGNFPGPLNTNQLTMGLTFIRNVAIGKVFRKLKYIEKLGSGFITIFQTYQHRKLPQPTVIEGDLFVKCVLPRPRLSSRMPLKKSKHHTTSDAILTLFSHVAELSVGEIMHQLHMPRATANRRLTELVKLGLIKKRGQGKGTRYYASE